MRRGRLSISARTFSCANYARRTRKIRTRTHRKPSRLLVMLACVVVAGLTWAYVASLPSGMPVHSVSDIVGRLRRSLHSWDGREINVRGVINMWTQEIPALTTWRSSALTAAVTIGIHQIPPGDVAVVTLSPDNVRSTTATGSAPSLHLIVYVRPRPIARIGAFLHAFPVLRGLIPAELHPGSPAVYHIRLGSLCANKTPLLCSGMNYDGAIIVS